MNGDLRPAHEADVPEVGGVELFGPAPRRTAARRSATAPTDDSRIAIEIRGLVERGEMEEARDRFGELVAVHIIPRPHVNVDQVLPLGRTNSTGG